MQPLNLDFVRHRAFRLWRLVQSAELAGGDARRSDSPSWWTPAQAPVAVAVPDPKDLWAACAANLEEAARRKPGRARLDP